LRTAQDTNHRIQGDFFPSVGRSRFQFVQIFPGKLSPPSRFMFSWESVGGECVSVRTLAIVVATQCGPCLPRISRAKGTGRSHLQQSAEMGSVASLRDRRGGWWRRGDNGKGGGTSGPPIRVAGGPPSARPAARGNPLPAIAAWLAAEGPFPDAPTLGLDIAKWTCALTPIPRAGPRCWVGDRACLEPPPPSLRAHPLRSSIPPPLRAACPPSCLPSQAPPP